MGRNPRAIRRRALRINQESRHPIFMFALTGAEILQIAEISRLSRSGNGNLIGYQRPEVRRHIQNIVEYLNSDDVLFPNSIILALSSAASFNRMLKNPLGTVTGCGTKGWTAFLPHTTGQGGPPCEVMIRSSRACTAS